MNQSHEFLGQCASITAVFSAGEDPVRNFRSRQHVIHVQHRITSSGSFPNMFVLGVTNQPTDQVATMASSSDTNSRSVHDFWVKVEALHGKLCDIINIVNSYVAKKGANRILSITDATPVVNNKNCIS